MAWKLRLVICICAAVVLLGANALAQQVMGTPESAESMVVEQERIVTYTIKSGDTLWDIAGAYYQKPWRWPEIWEINPYIEDPHWIYPGNTLQVRTVKMVYRTTGEEVPSVAQPKVPPLYIEELPSIDTTFLYKTSANQIDWISEDKIQYGGKVIEDIDDRKILSEFEWVWFDYDQEANLQIGDRLTVYDVEGKVKGGYVVRMKGEIETIDVVYMEKRERYVYKGAIRNASLEVKPDDMLFQYDDRPLVITLNKTEQDIQGEIIHYVDTKTIEGEFDYCFINVGNSSGVEVGNSFSIYRKPHNKRKVPYYYIGNIIIIKVEENFATALITNSLLDIHVGDEIRSDQL